MKIVSVFFSYIHLKNIGKTLKEKLHRNNRNTQSVDLNIMKNEYIRPLSINYENSKNLENSNQIQKSNTENNISLIKTERKNLRRVIIKSYTAAPNNKLEYYMNKLDIAPWTDYQ